MEILKLFVQKWCDAPLAQVLLSPGWRQGHKHNLVIVLPLLCSVVAVFPPFLKHGSSFVLQMSNTIFFILREVTVYTKPSWE